MPQRGIVLMVVRQLELTGAGIVVGLVGASVLTQVMASLLFGVGPTDAMTFATVPLILIVSAVLASYVPARGLRTSIRSSPCARSRREPQGRADRCIQSAMVVSVSS